MGLSSYPAAGGCEVNRAPLCTNSPPSVRWISTRSGHACARWTTKRWRGSAGPLPTSASPRRTTGSRRGKRSSLSWWKLARSGDAGAVIRHSCASLSVRRSSLSTSLSCRMCQKSSLRPVPQRLSFGTGPWMWKFLTIRNYTEDFRQRTFSVVRCFGSALNSEISGAGHGPSVSSQSIIDARVISKRLRGGFGA